MTTKRKKPQAPAKEVPQHEVAKMAHALATGRIAKPLDWTKIAQAIATILIAIAGAISHFSNKSAIAENKAGINEAWDKAQTAVNGVADHASILSSHGSAIQDIIDSLPKAKEEIKKPSR